MENDPDSLDGAQIGAWEEYGLDEEAPVPPEVNTNNNVSVPETRVNFCPNFEQYFIENIDPVMDDGNEGIHLFNNLLQVTNQHLNENCCQVMPIN